MSQQVAKNYLKFLLSGNKTKNKILMKIAGMYSFKGGKETIEQKYPKLLEEVQSIINQVDSEKCRTKRAVKNHAGKMLYSPESLNSRFKKYFTKLGWNNQRVPCQYPTQYYTSDYVPDKRIKVLSVKWILSKKN